MLHKSCSQICSFSTCFPSSLSVPYEAVACDILSFRDFFPNWQRTKPHWPHSPWSECQGHEQTANAHNIVIDVYLHDGDTKNMTLLHALATIFVDVVTNKFYFWNKFFCGKRPYWNLVMWMTTLHPECRRVKCFDIVTVINIVDNNADDWDGKFMCYASYRISRTQIDPNHYRNTWQFTH